MPRKRNTMNYLIFTLVMVLIIAMVGLSTLGREKALTIAEAWQTVLERENGKRNYEGPETERLEAIKIAKKCIATKGAVATISYDRSRNLTEVKCTAKVKQEN